VLNAEIAKLKAGMSPEGSSTALTLTGEVDSSKLYDADHRTPSPTELHLAGDGAVDPAVMQEKIKELSSRISEVRVYAVVKV